MPNEPGPLPYLMGAGILSGDPFPTTYALRPVPTVQTQFRPMKLPIPSLSFLPMSPESSAPRGVPALLLLWGVLVLCAQGCGDGDGGGEGTRETAGRSGASGARLAFQSARNFLNTNDLEEAEREFRRAIELDPAYTEAYFELGQLLVRLSYVIVGSGSRDQEKLGEGIANLKKALELEPANAAFAYWVGRAAHIGEDLEAAREYLDMAISLNPENGLAHKRLGLLLMDESELEAACRSFEAAMELLPEDGGLRFQYGNALENISQPEKAMVAYEEATRVDRTMPAPYNSLARLREAAGDSEGAEEALKMYSVWQRWDQDLQAAQRKVQRRPGDAKALLSLGEQYFAAGKFRESLQWFNRVVDLERRNALAHLYCGIARREIGDMNFSVDHLEEAAFLSPDSLEPKIELIRTCKLADKEPRIIELITQVEEEASEDPESLFELGLVCAEIERDDDARRLYEKVAALDPSHSEVRAALQKLGAGG